MAKTSGPGKRRLTIYLMKEGLKSDQCLEHVSGLKSHPIDNGSGMIGELFVRPSRTTAPDWVKFFEAHVDVCELKQRNSSSAGCLFIQAEKRLFAVTFGHGRHFLKSGSWEARFGLIATLNSIKPGTVRSIDMRRFDSKVTNRRIQTTTPGSPREFGLDIEQDLLQAVTGVPDDSNIGERITGHDSLVVNVALELDDLKVYLGRCLKAFRSTKYKEMYPWVDHIALVKDPTVVDRLEGLLERQLQTDDFKNLWMAVPEIIDWQLIAGFVYKDSSEKTIFEELSLSNFFSILRPSTRRTVKLLKQRKVWSVDDSGQRTRYDKWSIYKCLCFETEDEENSYLLNDGKWFRVEPTYATDVRNYYKNLPLASVKLPACEESTAEAKYNEVASKAQPEQLALMDRKLIQDGAYDKIEFCDLYTLTGQMIHVKKYGASSVLSHLFAQGLVAAELFLQDAEFRSKVNAKLPESHRLEDPAAPINPENFEVVYAIIIGPKKRLHLPLFSLVNLKNASSRLTSFGFKVSMKEVRITTAKHKTKSDAV